MAGDNVAISAGLALINMIKAILELMKTAMETKSKQLGNRIKELESKIKEKDKEIAEGKGDTEKVVKERDTYKKELDELKNQKSKADVTLDAIKNKKPEDIASELTKGTSIDGTLKPEDAAKMFQNVQNIMNIIIDDPEKSVKVRAAKAAEKAENITFNAQNKNQDKNQGMSFGAQKDNNESRT